MVNFGLYNLEKLTLELMPPSCSMDDISSDVDATLVVFFVRILRDILETEVWRKIRLSLTLDITNIFGGEALRTREHSRKISYLSHRNQGYISSINLLTL